MNKLLKLEVKTDKVFLDFQNHFELDGNKKILFSAKYGTGKSFFLNAFFSDEKIKDKHSVITISPVNYSVSQNEDIFELIKADIIRNFFLDGTLKFVDGDISFDKLTVVEQYLKHSIKHPYKIGKQLIYGLAKLGSFGSGAEKGVDVIFDMIRDVEKFEKKLNEKYKPKEKTLDEYSEEMQNKIGSYLEYNFISSLISEILIKIKTNREKENVIIIEDFDRLDPAHIFRILNIFSAHTNGDENKFGFDKVIIVCDLQNIRSLYKHLYGDNIDFEGYIDKFYSYSPYHFDNTKAIKFFIEQNFQLPIEGYATNALIHLLKVFDANEIDARIRLRKFNKSSSVDLNENIPIIKYDCSHFIEKFQAHQGFPIDNNVKYLEIFSNDIPLILIVKFLKNLYGGYDQLLNILDSKNLNIGRMNSPDSFNYLKLLVIPYHMCHADDYYKLFFESKNDISFPELTFPPDGRMRLNTKWKFNDLYSSGSYYDKITLNYSGNSEYLMDFNIVLSTLKEFIKMGLEREWLN